MNAVTIPAAQTEVFPQAELASLIAARLCHDLVSPLGAIGNGVELLEMTGDFPGIAKSPELALIGDSVRAARARVQFFRMAFGHAGPGQRVALAEIAQLAREYGQNARLAVEIEAEGDASRVEARMLLLAVMCMDSAMPWGGRLLVCRTPQGWRLVGEASRTRISPELWAWLAPRGVKPATPEPAQVHFALLGVLSAAGRRPILWDADATGAEIGF